MAKRKYSYQPTPETGWRKRLNEWQVKFTQRDLNEVHEEIENLVYGMALDGMKLTDIAHYFGVMASEMDSAYGDVWRAARAELKATLYKDQLQTALSTKQPIMKIWAGKQFAGQADQPGADVSVGSDGTEVTVTIHRAAKPEEPEGSEQG